MHSQNQVMNLINKPVKVLSLHGSNPSLVDASMEMTFQRPCACIAIGGDCLC